MFESQKKGKLDVGKLEVSKLGVTQLEVGEPSNSDIACKGYCLALPFPHIRMMNYVKIFLLRWITLIFTFISMPRQGLFSEVEC